MKIKVIALLLNALLLMCSSIAWAAPQRIEADGSYTIGDGLEENLSLARARAKSEAMRNASEQASVLVESLSLVQEGKLTKDEILVISSNIMQLQGEPKFKIVPVSDDVIRYQCHVVVLVDTDHVNAQLLQDKSRLAEAVRQNQELTAEVERLNQEMEQLRRQYANAATDHERRQIRIGVRRNEDDFAAVQLNEQGAQLYAAGHYRDAVGMFSQAIAKNPDYAYAYHNRGTAYGKQQQYREAIVDFTRALNLEPNYATAYGGRGFAYYALGNYANAAADFSKALALNPDYAEAHYGRGNAYMSLQHYQEALRDYEQALRLNPQLEEARTNRDMIVKSLAR